MFSKGFVINIAAGTTVGTTGTVELGFQPKALRLSWHGRSELVDTIGLSDTFRGSGLCAGTTQRVAGNVSARHPQSNSSTVYRRTNDAMVCIGRSAGTNDPTLDGRLDLQSFNATSFTWIVDELFVYAQVIMGIAWGGDDIQSKVFTFTEPAAIGARAITGVGFRGNVLFTQMFGQRATDVNDDDGHSLMSIGVATGPGDEQALFATVGLDAHAIMDTNRYAKRGECAGFGDGTNMVYRDQFVEWGNDGFTLNCLERDSLRLVDAMVISGGAWKVGSLQTRTDTNPIPVTNLPMTPQTMLFLSHCTSESTVDVVQAHDLYSEGICDRVGFQRCQASRDTDGLADSEVTTAIRYADVYASIASPSALDGAMRVTSIDANGFTCAMSDPDAAAAMVVYVAIGQRTTARLGGEVRISGTVKISSQPALLLLVLGFIGLVRLSSFSRGAQAVTRRRLFQGLIVGR